MRITSKNRTSNGVEYLIESEKKKRILILSKYLGRISGIGEMCDRILANKMT